MKNGPVVALGECYAASVWMTQCMEHLLNELYQRGIMMVRFLRCFEKNQVDNAGISVSISGMGDEPGDTRTVTDGDPVVSTLTVQVNRTRCFAIGSIRNADGRVGKSNSLIPASDPSWRGDPRPSQGQRGSCWPTQDLVGTSTFDGVLCQGFFS